MNLSERGAIEIVSHEAIVLTPYYDSVGVLTWGVGHTAAAGEPLPSSMWGKQATVADALRVFRKDAERYAARVRAAFTRPLTQEQFDAAVSFDFNTGAIHRATWVKKFNAGDIAGARKSFMDWRKPKEIIPRRAKERDLFFDGKYTGNGIVSVYPADEKGKVLWSQGKRVNLLDAIAVEKAKEAPKPAPAPTPAAKPETPASKPPASPFGLIVTLAAIAIAGIGTALSGAWDALLKLMGF